MLRTTTASSQSCDGTLMRFMPTLATPMKHCTRWSGLPRSTRNTRQRGRTRRRRLPGHVPEWRACRTRWGRLAVPNAERGWRTVSVGWTVASSASRLGAIRPQRRSSCRNAARRAAAPGPALVRWSGRTPRGAPASSCAPSRRRVLIARSSRVNRRRADGRMDAFRAGVTQQAECLFPKLPALPRWGTLLETGGPD
jgi:hypothetical protein